MELAICTSGKALSMLKGSRATYVPIQSVFFSKNTLNHILHLLQHGFVVEECRCCTDLPAVQIFHQLKTFSALWNAKYNKYPGQHSSPKGPATSVPRCLLTVVKRRRNATQWETVVLSKLFTRSVAAVAHFKMSQCFSWNSKCLSFNMFFMFYCELNIWLWDLQIIAFCLYLQFTKHSNFFWDWGCIKSIKYVGN